LVILDVFYTYPITDCFAEKFNYYTFITQDFFTCTWIMQIN